MKWNKVLTVLSFATSVMSVFQGINIGMNSSTAITLNSSVAVTANCRDLNEWDYVFDRLQSYSDSLNTARINSAADCGTLDKAAPAALKRDGQILVGVLLHHDNETAWAAEKDALNSAFHKYGAKWLRGVAVGWEDLFRGTGNSSLIVARIAEVRTVLKGWDLDAARIGHVDTWDAWVNLADLNLINAVDFIGIDVYPFWAGVHVDKANASFWDSVGQVRAKSEGLRELWITETGWPVAGKTIGDAVASIATAQKYWSEVACGSFGKMPFFWYDLDDFSFDTRFAIANQASSPAYQPNFDLTCQQP